MKYLLFYISVYNFIFPIRLTFIPQSELLIFAIPLLWFLINLNKFRSILNYIRYTTSFYYVAILILFGTLSSLLNNGDYISLIIFFKFLCGLRTSSP